MQRMFALKNWGILVLAAFAVIVGLHFVLDAPLQAFVASILSEGVNKIAVFFVSLALLTSDILLPIPSSVIAVGSALSLGFWLGFVCVWLGLCAACCFGYFLGSVSRGKIIKQFFSEKEWRIARDYANRWGLLALVFFRAVPVMAEVSVVAAGWLKISFKRFLLVCAMANAGIALVYTLIAVWAVQEASFVLAFFASVALPASLMFAWKKFASKSKVSSTSENLPDTLNPEFTLRFHYPLHFCHGVFQENNPCFAQTLGANPHKQVKAQFFIDQCVWDANANLKQAIQSYCQAHNIHYCDQLHVVPGGDAAKSQTQIEAMYQNMLDVALDRQSYVVAIGGGGVLDAVGYAAATFHRGIRLVRMPTTVLAQNDAGVGVKNGINAMGIKNLYGSFAVPTAIINDLDFLQTLSKRDYRSGFAEAIKVALIRDGQFFYWIEKNIDALNRRDEKAARYLIQRCAELHLNQICNGGDPFEQGSARPLDYGHWAAHKLEALTKHELSHGEAVAIGMALDALYAAEVGLCTEDVSEKVIELISALGFNVWHPALCWENEAGESALVLGLEEFRQHLGGELCITLLTGIGTTLEVNQIETAALLRAREKLRKF